MANLTGLHPEVRQSLQAATAALDQAGIPWSISPHGAFRSYADQQYLYANRGSNPNPVAAPGTSPHEAGYAVDVSFNGASPDQAAQGRQIMAAHGFGQPVTNDPPHFEFMRDRTGAAPAMSPNLTPIQHMAVETAGRHGIPPERFLGLIQTESGFNPNARSPLGAVGLGQLMPGTAAGLGVKNRLDPQANLEGAARYYRQQYDRFGDWDVASAAYNKGPGAIVGGAVPGNAQGYVSSVNQYTNQWGSRLQPGGTAANDLKEQLVPFTPVPSAPPRTSQGLIDLIDQVTLGHPSSSLASGREAPGTFPSSVSPAAAPTASAPGGVQALIDQVTLGSAAPKS